MKTRSLTEALSELRAKIGEPYNSLNDAMVTRLIEAQSADRALKAGDRMPDFALTNVEGALLSAQDLLARGPVALSFYRGIWCPFCSSELTALNQAEAAIREAGGQLVAVTPEARGLPMKVKQQRHFNFEILCDLDNGLALSFGLVFRISPQMIEVFARDGTNFPVFYDNDSWFLPIPATYVVGRDGVIAHAYVNPDFRYRLDPDEILSALRSLR